MRLGLFCFFASLLALFIHPLEATLTAVPLAEDASAALLFRQGQKAYEGVGSLNKRPDYRGAVHFFTQAADMGHAESAYMLGLMNYRGEGVASPNFTEAARYYMLAAAGNFPKAQYNLAVLYYEGRGVVRSDAEAYRWLLIAAANKEPRAQKMLPVASRNLSPVQKSQAEAQAREFFDALSARP